MHDSFPPYIVKDGVATITVRAKNGFAHQIKVPTDGSGRYATDALAFLMTVHPFEIKGGKRKKLFRNGKNLAELWARFVYQFSPDLTFGVVRCENHDWLDWTNGNIHFVTTGHEQRQKHFEDRNAAFSNFLSEESLEFLHRYNRPTHLPYGLDPDVADIFKEAQQRLPARSRPYTNPDHMVPKRDKCDFHWFEEKIH